MNVPVESDVAASATAAPAAGIDDRVLVERTLHGEAGAFALIMRRHNRRLFRLARATLGDAAEAEDAVQDAYLAAFRSLGEFRHEAALSTWLSRLVLNQCFARRRREARRQKIVPMHGARHGGEWEQVADATAAPDRDAMRAEILSLLERHLDALPKEFRVAFVLRDVEEMGVREAAASLGVAEATVRSRAFRARRMLRETLTREFDLAIPDVYEFGGARCDRIVATVLARLHASP